MLTFDELLQALVEKQRMHGGDRSHPRLVQLDSQAFSYPGWQEDAKKAEEEHATWNTSWTFIKVFNRMKYKQEILQPGLVPLDQRLPVDAAGWPTETTPVDGADSAFPGLDVETSSANPSHPEEEEVRCDDCEVILLVEAIPLMAELILDKPV